MTAIGKAKTARRARGFMRVGEEVEAERFFMFTRLYAMRFPALAGLYHVPNEAKRSPQLAGKLKRAGLCAGVPDYHLDKPANGYHGWKCELKALDGEVTDTQQLWLRAYDADGYRAVVAWGWVAAAFDLFTYLAIPIPADLSTRAPYAALIRTPRDADWTRQRTLTHY